jgi:site-specific recombinase XerD
MAGPEQLSPREAMQYFLDHRSSDSSEKTVRTYRNRLTQFVQWCEEQGIDRMSNLSGWDIDQYERTRRSSGDAPVTLKGKLNALKLLLEYCERIEVVDDDLPEKVEIPTVSREEETSDVKLAKEDAKMLLSFYRDSPGNYATNHHTLLEVLWNTGARLSGIRALDLGDYHPDQEYLEFEHRPQTGTPLKNNDEGERAVSLSSTVCDILDAYIERDRWEKRDEHGREPLFTCRQGRPSETTVRSWCYLGTLPCLHMECPHGEQRGTCEFVHRNHASKCPSSRSPHQIRTGSITWHRDRGVPLEVTSERVNASPDVIERFYDKATEFEKMENRRREHTENLDFDKNA